MVRIQHPRPGNGRQQFVGIEFRDGFADVDLGSTSPHIVDSLRMHGFSIEETFEGGSAVRPSKAAKRSNKGKAADDEKASENVVAEPTVPDSVDTAPTLAPGGIVSSSGLSIFGAYDARDDVEAFIPASQAEA